jgi:hypothetical protein
MKLIQKIGCLLLPVLLFAIPLEVKYGTQFAKTSANPYTNALKAMPTKENSKQPY